MTIFIALTALLSMVVGIWVLLARGLSRTADLPRMPFGVDADRDIDLWQPHGRS